MRKHSRNRKRGSREGDKTVKELARPFVALMLSQRELKEETLSRLKKETANEVLDVVLATAKQNRHRLLGNPQPKSLKKLGDSLPTEYSRDTAVELRWAVATALQYHKEIASFLACKDEIEHLLVRGEWSRAAEGLHAAQERLGKSLWGVEIEFLIQQRVGRLEGNRKLLRSSLEQAAVSWSRVFYAFFSHKAEDATSSQDYAYSTIILDSEPSEGASRSRFRDYLKFRVDPNRYDGPLELGFFLHMEEANSVFDRYLMLQRVATHLFHAGKGIAEATRARLKSLAGLVGDTELQRALAAGEPSTLDPITLDEGLFVLIDHYTTANYPAAVCEARRLLKERPLRFEYYELAGKAIARVNGSGEGVLPKDSPGESILADVVVVAQRGADWPKAIQRLDKLSLQFASCRLGPLLRDFVREHAETSQGASPDTRIQLVISEFTPRSCMEYADARGETLMAAMRSRFPDNPAVKLFSWALGCLRGQRYEPPPDGMPPTRVLKYQAYVFEQLNRFEDALAVYAQLDHLGEGSAGVIGEALRGRYRCYLKLNRLSACATELAKVGVGKPHLVFGADLNDLLRMYPVKGRHRELKRNIAWPVLFALAQSERHQPLNSHRLFQVLDDFLTACDVQRPSELSGQLARFDKSLLVFLLRHVCVLDVLDSFFWYDSQEEVEAERTAVCEWLSQLDPDHRIEYSAEQGALKHRAYMRELAHQSGRSKIYVDVEGIVSSLPDAMPDRIVRSLTYSELSAELREGLDIPQKLAEVGFSKEEASRAHSTFVDEGFKLFRSIFHHLQNQFLHSVEYGLDSNLSQRVRHGTLSGAIRPIFESFHFVTRNTARGDYAENTHWLERFTTLSCEERETVDGALRRLSKEVDDTVELVRNTWLQIKGEANGYRGYFDFDYTIPQIESLNKRATSVASAEAYVSAVFEELWDRTEINLRTVREAITGRLREMLSDSLDRCAASVAHHGSEDANAEFRTAVTSCKTQLANDLKTISDWFYIDDTQWVSDFTIGNLVDSLVENINRFAGAGGLVLTKKIVGREQMPGVWFRALWDLFFILLNNVLKHSGQEQPTAEVLVERTDERLAIAISNPLGPGCELNTIKQALRAYRERAQALGVSRVVKGEGGSGFAKLHKIIRFDFRCAEYTIEPRFINDESFEVAIGMQLKGAKDESPGRR